MTIFDAHLDLAYNAALGADVTLPAAQQERAQRDWQPSVGLPDLVAGGVRHVCGTIFCEPAHGDRPGYRTAYEARQQAQRQLRWYYRQMTEGRLALASSRGELEDEPAPGCVKFILLMEGADALLGEDDVRQWHEAGLRVVGLAWKRTRMAGGTGEPGGLTAEGREIVRALDLHGIIHDASHLAEEAFWELLEASAGPVIATHSNCRAIVPTDRQLSDEMIQAIAARGGVIGINFFQKFLLPPHEQTRRATLADVVAHVKHLCDLVGHCRHVGLGTDMDGGFGAQQIPAELTSSADLPRVAQALSAGGFTESDVAAILSGNWLRFFRERLA